MSSGFLETDSMNKVHEVVADKAGTDEGAEGRRDTLSHALAVSARAVFFGLIIFLVNIPIATFGLIIYLVKRSARSTRS